MQGDLASFLGRSAVPKNQAKVVPKFQATFSFERAKEEKLVEGIVGKYSM